ncbi:EDA [Branchiostoma lanceolatum]|uniref:EDA protein n=1 Tax=Branchiostoma lanceolatum TaxID=7740 RepID=A0A8K0EC58_BRALA|nr:EDA [Branchiostoma lanceolatum]
MALEASPNRGEGELVVIPRRSFYAVIFGVTLLVLTSLALGVGGFVYLLRQVEQLRTTRCACTPVKRDVARDLTGEVEPHADWHVAAAADQLSAILRNGRDKRNLPWLDVDEELPDVVLESLGLEAEEAREEGDSVPAGKKGGRGKKGTGLKAAHIQGDAGGAVPVGADGQVNHWKVANWMLMSEYEHYSSVFRLDVDGSLLVTEAGLYFVYSQVYYYDGSHAFLSHIIRGSGEEEPFLQCIQSPVNESRKYNTCFTAGVFHLDADDRIVVKLQQENGVVDMSPDTTFFGLIKIAGPPPPKKRVRRPKNKDKERGSSG